MKTKFKLSIAFMMLLFVLSCKKDTMVEMQDEMQDVFYPAPDGIYEVITFSYGPAYWDTCQELDTISIEDLGENRIRIGGHELELQPDTLNTESHRYTKWVSNVESYSCSYYPACDSISYAVTNGYIGSGNGYSGRKLGTVPCVVRSINSCKDVATNQVCIDSKRQYRFPLDYAAIISNPSTQKARLIFFNNISLNADSTSYNENEDGNYISFFISFTDRNKLAGTYSFSDGSLSHSASYEIDNPSSYSEPGGNYYTFDSGTLHIESQNEGYVFKFHLKHCIALDCTGYFDGLFLEW